MSDFSKKVLHRKNAQTLISEIKDTYKMRHILPVSIFFEWEIESDTLTKKMISHLLVLNRCIFDENSLFV